VNIGHTRHVTVYTTYNNFEDMMKPETYVLMTRLVEKTPHNYSNVTIYLVATNVS
jgi:hypothetical protein